jgi:hypothetical protein
MQSLRILSKLVKLSPTLLGLLLLAALLRLRRFKLLSRVSSNLVNFNMASLNLALPADPAQIELSNVPLLQASSHLVKFGLILFDTLLRSAWFFTPGSRSTLAGFAFLDHEKPSLVQPSAARCSA